MNERIRELVKQADIEFDVSSDNYGVDTATVTPYDLEKFAELIVQECVTICEQQRTKILQNPNDPSWTEHLAEVQINIKQHFGIK
jgi:hypothetical protein